MLQLFRTSRGLARRDGSDLLLLETSSDLDEHIRAGTLLQLQSAPARARVRLTEVALLPPVTARRFIFVGLNYASHAEEAGQPIPKELMFGVRDAGASQSSPAAVIELPADAPSQVDYEGEIAVVIGRELKHATPHEAVHGVAAITAAIDLTARDVQFAALREGGPKHPGITGSKLFPGFKPFGPGLLSPHPDEVDGLDLRLETFVNGELRQQASSREMIFSFARCLSLISAEEPLGPGDVVLTGTPAGVGFPKGRFLACGDRVSVRLGGLPDLEVTLR